MISDVVIIWDECVSKKIVGHVSLDWSKAASKFLQLTNHHIRVEVTGKRLNRGVGLGLEIPCKLFFYGDARVITWVKNSLEKLDSEFHIKVKKCVK